MAPTTGFHAPDVRKIERVFGKVNMREGAPRWGDKPAVRLRPEVIKALDPKEGDVIENEATPPRRVVVSRRLNSSEKLAQIKKYRRRLPSGFVFDRLEAHELNSHETCKK